MDKQILLETLTLETVHDWTVQFGEYSRTDPRLDVMRLVPVFPCLKCLYLDQELLLGPGDGTEPRLKNLLLPEIGR